PCYQNSKAPDLDRERGRIWRLVYVGNEPGKIIATHEKGMDLGKLDDAGLASVLGHPNIWQRRTAQRLLVERMKGWQAPIPAGLAAMALSVDPRKVSPEARMAAVWTLGSIGQLRGDLADTLSV